MEACLELTAYAATSALSAALWLAYAPSAKAVERRFGWSPSQVAALGLWPPVVALVGAPLAPRIVDRLGGARQTTTCCALLVAIAAAVRVVPGDASLRLGLAHAGGAVNAVAGVLILSTPAVVSRLSVSPPRRVAATSCLLAANNLGAALGFVVAAAVQNIDRLLWYEFFVAAAAFFCLALPRHYVRRAAPADADEALLPPESPEPPKACCLCGELATARSYLLLAWGYGLAAGSFTGWQGVLTPILEQRGWAPRRCDALGVAIGVAMAVAQVAFAPTRERAVVVGCSAVAAAGCAALALVVSDESSPAVAAVASASAAAFFAVAPEGVVYELATRRLPERLHAAAGAGLVWCFNVPMGVFVGLATLGTPPVALTWGLALAVLCGLGLVSIEAITRRDYPLFDSRPRSADDEMRPRDAILPSIAAPPPPPPPPKQPACRVKPCLNIV